MLPSFLKMKAFSEQKKKQQIRNSEQSQKKFCINQNSKIKTYKMLQNFGGRSTQ